MSLQSVNCDSLWRPWYSIVAVCMQIFLIYSGIMRYQLFKEQAFDAKYGGHWSHAPMNFCLVMLICAITLTCIFIITILTERPKSMSRGLNMHPNPVYMQQFSWPNGRNLEPLNGTSGGGLYATTNGVMLRSNLEDENMPGSVPIGVTTTFDTWSARSAPLTSELGNLYMGTGRASNFNHQMLKKHKWSYLVKAWRRLQQSFVPRASLMHLLSAYCLLICQPVLEGQLIHHRARSPRCLWLNILSTIIPSASEETESSLLARASTSCPVVAPISVEYFNLLFALVTICLCYPDVFWRTSHGFSFLFSLILAIISVQGLIEASATCVLVKLCWNKDLIPGGAVLAGLCNTASSPKSTPQALEIGQSSASFAMPAEDTEGLRNSMAIILSALATICMVCLSTTVFEYGLLQLHKGISALRGRVNGLGGGSGDSGGPGVGLERVTTASNLEGSSDSTSNHAGCSGNFKSSKELSGSEMERYSRGYVCHLASVIGSLCVLAMKTPIFVACIQIYQVRRDTIFLAHMLATVILFCFWFIVWFAFCLKPSWNFKILCQPGQNNCTVAPCFNSTMLTRPGDLTSFDPRSPRAGSGLCSLSVADVLGHANPGDIGRSNGWRSARLTAGSPIYACFHDEASAGPLCRPPMGVNDDLGGPGGQGELAHTVPGTNAHPGPRSIDCCSEDTEASSRQSGTNNYVCLHSSINNGAVNGQIDASLGPSSLPQPPPIGSNQVNATIQQPPRQQHEQTATHSLPYCGQTLSVRRANGDSGAPNGSVSTFDRRFGSILDGKDSTDIPKFGSSIEPRSFTPQRLDFTQGAGEVDLAMSSSDYATRGLFAAPGNSLPPISASGGLGQAPAPTNLPNPPRVTFAELTETLERSPTDSELNTNPNSSNDSGIDNQGQFSKLSETTRFHARPTISRSSLVLPFSAPRLVEPTYYNQEHFLTPTTNPGTLNAGSTSQRTFSLSECPSMPPLHLSKLDGFAAAGAVGSGSASSGGLNTIASYSSLSRRFETSSMQNTSGAVNASSFKQAENLMSRSTVIGKEDRSGGLCSQV